MLWNTEHLIFPTNAQIKAHPKIIHKIPNPLGEKNIMIEMDTKMFTFLQQTNRYNTTTGISLTIYIYLHFSR